MTKKSLKKIKDYKEPRAYIEPEAECMGKEYTVDDSWHIDWGEDLYIPTPADMLRAEMNPPESAFDKQEGGAHYKNYAIQPLEFIMQNDIPYCEANVIKYTTRHRDKNGKQDILKAIHYLELILETEYGE
jgi:hypothetical protein